VPQDLTRETKYAEHTEPGGSNYRELLLRLPAPEGEPGDVTLAGEENGGTPANLVYPEGTFVTGHWAEPNVVAHLRVKDDVSANGERILRVEEIQSDWHQGGKTRGYSPETGGVPDGPMKDSWHEFALKRVLQMAVEEGYDRVEIVGGDRQAARYDLSKQIDHISFNRLNRGEADERVAIIAVAKNKDRVIDKDLRPDELREAVGEELAQRILDQPAGRGELSGLDLMVGGKGMKAFYDEKIPGFLNRYLKPFGVKVEASELGHSVRITPELAESVLSKGQPLYQDGMGQAKASVEFLADNRAIIRALENPDVSSAIHELGHVFRRDLEGPDLAIAEEWAGVRDGKWGVESEEKFTRGFERYMRDGQAPTEGLRGVFEQFKTWLTDIYRSLKGSPVDVQISPEMRQVFDRLLGGETQQTSAEAPTVPIGAVKPAAPEAPAAAPAAPPSRPPTKPPKLNRVWKAGVNSGEVVFASETQRDLFDIGAELRRSMTIRGKTSDRPARDIAPLIDELATRLKVSPEKVRQMALGVRADVSAQMKGMRNGDARTVTDQSSVDGIEEQLRKRLEDTVGVAELPIPGAGVTVTVGGASRTGGPDGPGASAAPDVRFAPEQEQAYQASKALGPKESTWSRVKDIAASAWHKATRPYEHLERGARHAEFFEDLKELEVRRGVASDKAIANMKGLLAGFSKEQYDLFNRKVVLDDLAEELARREARNAGSGKLFPDVDPASTDLAFKFDPATLAEAKKRVDAAVAADPRVAESIGLRKALWRKVTDDYLAAARDAIGFEPPMNRQNYFRNIVLDNLDAKRTQAVFQDAIGFHATTNDPFTKRREATNRNYLSDYVRAEHEALSLMLQRTREFEILRDIERRYNIGSELRATHHGSWQDHIPEGYVAWQPKPGRQFYEALTVPETYMRELMIQGSDPRAAIPVDELQKVLAAGRKNHEWVVPEEIAKTLDDLEADPQVVGVRKAVRLWKKFMLQGPHRFVKYNIRNVSGDADGLLAANPKAVAEVPAAAKDLYNFLYRGGAPSKELKRWVELGGMQDLFRGAELGTDVAGLKQFRHFFDKKPLAEYADPRSWMKAYNDAVGGASDAREALLRYAMFRQYRGEMARNPEGRPDSFGASLPDEVMAIADLDRRAHRMSNDALGAYNELTVMGKYLRDTAWPFWSWNEVNVKRYKRLIQNAFRDSETVEDYGRSALKTAGLAARRSPAIAYRVGKAAAQMSILSAGLAAYNLAFWSDEEADLPADVRKRPHIVLGRDEKGNVLYFDRMGAVGDALEWFGKYDDQKAVVQSYLDGKLSWYEAIGVAAKNAGFEATNKIVQGLGPAKTVAELGFGQQLYPSIDRPRPIRDKAGFLIEGLGFGPEYRAVMGRPDRGLERAAADQFYYQIDPNEAAYGDIRSLAAKFDEQLSGPKPKVSREPTPAANALYYYKQSLRYGDAEAAERYLNEFASLTLGREVSDRGTLTAEENKRLTKSLTAAVASADPLYGLEPEERAEFIASLSPRDRQQLEKAQKFWRETMMRDDAGFDDIDPRDFEMDPYGLMPKRRSRGEAGPRLSSAAESVYRQADPVVRAAIDFDLRPPTARQRKGEKPSQFSSRTVRTKEVWREAVRTYAPSYLDLPADQRVARRAEFEAQIKAYVDARIDAEFPSRQ